MQSIEAKYNQLCNHPSDINEHLPTFMFYAKQCNRILETGVRGCVSSWAFCHGLLQNNTENKKYLLLNDIEQCPIDELQTATSELNIEIDYQWCNNLDLDLDITENFDLVFIDTWHVYGQLKRELAKFAPKTNKWIIMHDTTVDEYYGESLRCMFDIKKQMEQTGFTRDEIGKGLKFAIDEFIENNSNWRVREKFVNNNGLTVLERIGGNLRFPPYHPPL